MDDPMIRMATSRDAGEVAEIYLLSRKTFLDFAPLAHSAAAVRKWIDADLIPCGGVMVAESRGAEVRLDGMMALSRKDGVGWIDQLYLRPSFVGQGLGSRLVAHAKTELGSPIRLYTFLANARARRFYEHHGFCVLEFGDGSRNEEGCPDVLYEWT